MKEYYPMITASIKYDDFVCMKEKFVVILDCDTLYPNYTHRSTDYYYKYDTLLELRAMDGLEYFWEPQTNLTAYDIQAPRMTDYQEHYLVTVTDKYDCVFHEEFHIILNCDTLYPGGSIIVVDTLLEDENSIVLEPRYGEVVSTWYPPIYLDCIDCQSPTARPRSYVSYSVELRDEFDCLHEEIFKFDMAIRIPNVITPNDDGYNDCWKVTGIPVDSELFIFEKNGSLKYSQKPFNSDYCWKGTDSNGNPLKAGSYWFAIEHPFFGTLKTGFILIKR
jgi:gliding motility-associated-like protein